MHASTPDVWKVRGPGKRAGILRGFLFSALTCVLLAIHCSAQSEQRENAPAAVAASDSGSSTSTDISHTPAHIHVHSDLVVIPVTVTDGKGRVVDGLQREDFTLYDDKVQQQITQFSYEDSPASIGVVFDTSDSMRPRLHKAREALAALLNDANPEDEYFLIQFSDRPRLLVDLTPRAGEIQQQAAFMQIGGSTALLDAVRVALDEMRNAHHTRKAIIIISDGDDNSSRYSVRELKEAVREADVLIYAIGIIDSEPYSQSWPPQTRSGPILLNDIARSTGGRLFEVSNLKQLPGIASKISAWLRSQYVLSYTRSDSEKDGEYHHIRVKITRPNGFPRLHSSWRLGYYAPAE